VRRNEALAIEWRHVDRRAKRIKVPQTKNRKAFSVRIIPPIAEILEELGGEGEGRLFPWQGDSVTHHFVRTARKAIIHFGKLVNNFSEIFPGRNYPFFLI